MDVDTRNHCIVPDDDPLPAGTRLAAIPDTPHSDNFLDFNQFSTPSGLPNSLHSQAANQEGLLPHHHSNNHVQHRLIRGVRRLFHMTFSFIVMISPPIISSKVHLVKKKK
ncbi:hypothetical protein V8E53_005432 [Lactarius tabidus]